ncbi:MAG: hypothetical protein V1887_04130 [Candidatus Aenigmatarchaeota archaeon]
MVDWLLVTGFGLLGGIIRTLLGWAKAYEQNFQVQRAWFGLVVSALSGAIAAVLIADDPKIAVIAGIGGSDIVEALWKGLARRTAGGVYATNAGVAPIWITARQMKAVQQAREKGRLTISEYQVISGMSKRTAQRDIDSLVDAGYLKAKGKGKGSYYVYAKAK